VAIEMEPRGVQTPRFRFVISAACSLWPIDISWSSSQFTTINGHVIDAGSNDHTGCVGSLATESSAIVVGERSLPA